MPESTDTSEFPSERAATFEEAKRELERKEAERQAALEKIMANQPTPTVQRPISRLILVRMRLNSG